MTRDEARGKLRRMLLQERDGKHGESERRCVGAFLLDVLDECNGLDELASSAGVLAEVAKSVAEEIGSVVDRLPEEEGDEEWFDADHPAVLDGDVVYDKA